MISTIDVKERLVVPAASSSYPALGASYRLDGYEVGHAHRLVRTEKNYHDSKAEIPEGLRMSTAGEELAIQLKYERIANLLRKIDERSILGKPPGEVADILHSLAATEVDKDAISYVFDAEFESMNSAYEQTNSVLMIDPRNAKVFDDLFARGLDKVYMWQWTETFLRTPSGKQNSGKPDYTDPQGRKHWVREFGNGSEVVGVAYVPEGGGRLVAEWDEVSGVPRVTVEDVSYPHNPYTNHFWFNQNLQEVAVERWGGWRHGEDERCLNVDADYGRSGAVSADGFRPVRGSFETHAERKVRFG